MTAAVWLVAACLTLTVAVLIAVVAVCAAIDRRRLVVRRLPIANHLPGSDT